MSKRPPEMCSLAPVMTLCAHLPSHRLNQEPAYLRAEVDPAIRSLRVKLFRERASHWRVRAYRATALGWTRYEIEQMFKRCARFSRIADAIERGER